METKIATRKRLIRPAYRLVAREIRTFPKVRHVGGDRGRDCDRGFLIT